MIRKATLADAKALLEIYNYYVIHTTVTFDENALSLSVFKDKVELILKAYPCIVFEENNEVLGFAYGSKFRPKPAYNYTVESTVYVKNGAHGKQIGSKLYIELIAELKKRDFKSVLGVLTIPNPASVKLHEKFGFTQVAHLKKVGFKFDTWLDVGIFQLNLK